MADSVVVKNNVVYSTIPEYIYPNDNMVKFLFAKFNQWPERHIMIDYDTKRSWTAKQFQSAVSTVAKNFVINFSLEWGDVVCFYCPNSDLLSIGTIATIAAGGIATSCSSSGPYCKRYENSIYFFYEQSKSADELRNVVSLTNTKFLVTHKDNLENALKVAQECNHVEEIFIIDDDRSDTSFNVHPFDCLMQNSSDTIFCPVAVEQDDICIILFSSGSAGLPKPVAKTHKNMLANENCNRESFDFSLETDITAITWDLFFSSQMKLLSTCLLAGTKFVMFNFTDLETYCNLIQEYRITKIVVVPSYVIQMVKAVWIDKYDLSSLEDVLLTGSMVPEEMALAFVNKFKVKYLRQVYGLTEVSTCVMQQKIDYSKKNLLCVGIPTPGCSVKIIDRNTNSTLGPNCVGELCTKGPCVMSGFLNMPQENENGFDADGYYKTGDAAYYDATGRIFIVDRYKNILKFEGGAVSCTELESILLRHPQIKEACVIGIQHELYGEVPRAFIVVDHGHLTQENVTDFVNSHVIDYKRLYGGVVFIDRMPKTNLGKVKRNALATEMLIQ